MISPMDKSNADNELKKYQQQEFTPGSYKEWLSRSEEQDDPYAEFFMLFVAAVSSQEHGNNEYEKISALCAELEQVYKDTLASSDINNTLDGMLKYIIENRHGVEIQNLSTNRSRNTPSETCFLIKSQRLTNALTSMLIVRNNLFHGDKRAYNQNDIEIIRRCNAILKTTLLMLGYRQSSKLHSSLNRIGLD